MLDCSFKYILLRGYIFLFLIFIYIIACNQDYSISYFNSERSDTIVLSSLRYIEVSKNDSIYLIIFRKPNTNNFKIICNHGQNLDKVKYYFIPKEDGKYNDSIIFSANDCCGIDSAIWVFHWEKDKVYKKECFRLQNKKLITSDLINEGIHIIYIYYPDGKLKSIQKHMNDSIWEYKFWNNSGGIEAERTSTLNLFINRYWFENGILMQEDLTDIKTNKEIMSRVWCDNGLLIDSSLFNIGIFERKRYYCSGKLEDDWIYLNSPQYPYDITEWYENGNLKFSGHFKRDKNPKSGGLPHGLWSFYDLFGKLVRTEFYVEGNLTRETGKLKKKEE